MTQYEAYLPSYIDNKITAVVGGAPSNLNTLAKLAQSIGNNANLNINIQEQLNGKQNVIMDNSLPMNKIAGLDIELQNKYTKTEVNALLAGKQSLLTVDSVPITHVINLQSELDKKTNNTDLVNIYNKTEVNNLLAGKQNTFSSNSIPMNTVINLENELEKKAYLISPTFLGNPTAPTAAISSNNTQIATTEFVVDKIDELVINILEDMQTDIEGKVTTAQLNAAVNTKYDKSEVNTLLAAKQDLITELPVAKITNLQMQLDAKASLINPAFIGVPTAPTASISTNNTQIATTAFVKDVVSGIIDGAPDALNTLKEISTALQDDKNIFTTINNTLATKAPTNNAVFQGTTTFTGALNVPINGLNIANISGLQTEINDLKTNTSFINNLTDGAIPLGKINGLPAALDTKLTASSSLDAGKIINWANVMNNAIDIAKINTLQTQLDAKTGNADAILLTRVTGLEDALDDKADSVDVYTKSEVDTSLAGKQNTIADGGLTIAKTNGLQAALDGKLATTGSIPISQVTNLQTSLNNKAPFSALGDDPNYATTVNSNLALKANIADVYTKAEINTSLAGKQNSIADGDLTIARTNGLQAALDGKLATTGSIPISQVTNLQTSLNNKAPFSALGDDPNYATTVNQNFALKANVADVYTRSQVDTSLSGKQNTVQDGDLTIARTSGLQAALDGKLATSGSIPISQVTNLQTTLNNKAPFSALGDDPNYATTVNQNFALKANVADVYTRSQVDTSLSGKQNTVQDGDLTIARTSGLQAALDGKLATSGSIPISQVTNLQTTLSNKAPFSALGDDPNYATTVNQNFALKANVADVYTKTQTDTLLTSKANTADVYTKAQIDIVNNAQDLDNYTKYLAHETALSAKANSAAVYTKTEVDALVVAGGGSATLSAYASEADAYFNEGLGTKYLLNGNSQIVSNLYRPIYSIPYNTGRQLTGTLYTAYTNLATAGNVTFEAWVLPNWTGLGLSSLEWYIFDTRSSDAGGYAFGIRKESADTNASPITYSTATTLGTSQTGTGGARKKYGASPVVRNAQWCHLAFTIDSTTTTIKCFFNGSLISTVTGADVGTNYAPGGVNFGAILIGNYVNSSGSSFRWAGSIGPIRISNSLVYTTSFTPTFGLAKTSSTVFLLGNDYKEIVSNQTLTQSGGSIANTFDSSTGLLTPTIQPMLNPSTPPKLTNFVAYYIPSSIASDTQWGDSLGWNSSLTINSTMFYSSPLYQYLLSYAQNASPITISLANHASVKSIVIVAMLGVNPSPGTLTNKILLSDSSNGNNWYVSPRASGQVWNSNIGTSATLHVNGLQIQDTNGQPAGAVLYTNAMLYAGKWSVLIFNNLTLPNGNINFLGYSGDATWTPYTGYKVGAIVIYNQTLTAAEITSLSTWGLKNFSAF